MKVMKRSRRSERTLTSCMNEMRLKKHSDILSHAMCARNECDSRDRTRTKKTITTTRTFTCSPSVSRHCWVSCASC